MEKTEEGRTPIHFAASNGHSNVVEFLAPLAAKCSYDITDMPNAPDYLGRTPVQYAAESGYSNVIKIFASLPDPHNQLRSQISIEEIKVAMGLAAINRHKKLSEI